MPWILRTSEDQNNPTLPGAVYGKYITIGKAVYWRYDGANIRGIILISDGGKYGLDKIDSFEYKGAAWTAGTEYRFHRGTFTKQVNAFTVTVNPATDRVNQTAHGYASGTPLRFRAVDGNLPAPLTDTILGQSQKVWVINPTTNDFQLSSTDPASATTLIDLTNAGTGTLKAWKADAGFDDPVQGLPQFCPEVETTFSNIAYIEFSKNLSSSQPPDWADFRILGTGRRLMNYSAAGVELSIIAGDDDQLSNLALVDIDHLLNNFKVKPTRMDWPSWFAFKNDCDVQILQRVRTDETATTNGLTGRYYQGTTGHPQYPAFTQLVIARLDANVNIPSTPGTTAPAPGVNPSGFSIEWTGQLKARYSELTTLKLDIDDAAELWVNGNRIINAATLGSYSAQYNFIANELYDIVIKFRQGYAVGAGNTYKCEFRWSSASQTEEIVPSSRLFPADEVVPRYRVNTAFNAPVESSEVHERIMERAPGWDWTDDDGLIKFLPPNRNPVFSFAFDLVDDDSVANFANKSFEKKRRPLSDRKNFQLFRYRNIALTGYPYQFAQADREQLRRFTNGEPSNDPFSDLGVLSQSQAERMAEMEMVLKSDPEHTAKLDGGRASSKLRKNQKVTATYYDRDGNFVIDEEYLITLHSWGASNDRNAFSLLPLARNFYFDEPLEESLFSPGGGDLATDEDGDYLVDDEGNFLTV